MQSITMKLENVSLDVYYDAEVCKEAFGAGTTTTVEVDIHSVDIAGVNIYNLLSEDILLRIDEKIIEDAQNERVAA